MQYSWAGFSTVVDQQELELYHEKFFDVIVDIYQRQNKEFANSFYSMLFPYSEKFEVLTQKLIKLKEGLDKSYLQLKKNINESIDDLRRI